MLPDASQRTRTRDAGLVFHGLRKLAVVTLLEAGSDAEAAAITGQSRQMIEHCANEVSQPKLASSAINKWEQAANEGLQNRLQNSGE